MSYLDLALFKRNKLGVHWSSLRAREILTLKAAVRKFCLFVAISV